ncbi:hypothetical protein [Dinoroseobacter sp. S124A]|uniref:hypothetical protein n=1 Tax=Dinoroseobacter sp. S124A TaxID=3415128 RepID=UPI003C7C4919
MSDWQPIETAPVNVSVQIWVPGLEDNGNAALRAILVDLGTGRRWHTTAYACGRDLPPDLQPTHWMSPEPPETTPEQLKACIAELEAKNRRLRADCAKWEKMARAAMNVAVDAYDVPNPAELEAENAKLSALVAASELLKTDMLERARMRVDVISGDEYRVVNAGNSAWIGFCKALDAAQQEKG